MKYLGYIIGVSILFLSCSKDDGAGCFSSTGKIIEEFRFLDDFHKIELYDNVNVFLIQSDSNYAIVEAGKNVIDGVKTDVSESGCIKIQNVNNCNWIRSYEKPLNVYLYYSYVDTIEYRSIGDIVSNNLMQTDDLYVNVYEGAGKININVESHRVYCGIHYGTADIIISGKCGIKYLYSAGFGVMDCRDLECTFAYVNNKGSNNMYVNSTGALNVAISGLGDVYYNGSPSISLERTGSGNLIKLE